jgi:AcrR family transcriptional regulator
MALGPERVVTVSDATAEPADAWQERVIARSLAKASQRSIGRGEVFIEATIQLLAEADANSITIQDMAARSGHSLRTLYVLFESKNDLLLAALEVQLSRYTDQLRSYLETLQDPIECLAVVLARTAARPTQQGRASANFAACFNHLVAVNPRALIRVQQPLTDLVREIVVDAIAQGRLNDIGLDDTIHLIMSMWRHYTQAVLLGNTLPVDLPDLEVLIQFCLRGLGTELPPGWHPPELPDL